MGIIIAGDFNKPVDKVQKLIESTNENLKMMQEQDHPTRK